MRGTWWWRDGCLVKLFQFGIVGNAEKKKSLRKHRLSEPAFQSNRASCMASTTSGAEKEHDQITSSSAQKVKLIEKGKGIRRQLIKRENRTEPKADPYETPYRSRKKRFLWFWKTTQTHLLGRKELVHPQKKEGRSAEISLWKRMGC